MATTGCTVRRNERLYLIYKIDRIRAAAICLGWWIIACSVFLRFNQLMTAGIKKVETIRINSNILALLVFIYLFFTHLVASVKAKAFAAKSVKRDD